MYDVAPGHVPGLTGTLLLLPLVALFFAGMRVAARCGVIGAGRFLESFRASSPVTKAAAALILVTGAVHLALVPNHLDQGITAVLFGVDGLAFVGLSVAAFLGTWWRRPAALLLLATIFAYLLWVVAGWEGPDQVGIVSKLVELVALGLVWRSFDQRRRTWPRRFWRAIRLPLVTASAVLGVWVGGFAHPDELHKHAGALLQPVPAVPSADQRAAAAELLRETRAALAPYRDPAVAMAAGFVPGPASDADPLIHWTNKANGSVVLDPRHPQALVYGRTSDGLQLLGAMFQMPKIGQWGPDPGGPITQWHQHEGICFSPVGFEFSFETPFWTCPLGSISITTPPMLHVWLIDNPKGGPFAADLDAQVQRQYQRR